jgi:hypothetical protein
MLSKVRITTEQVTVTPEKATKWLEQNTHNRAISQTKVEQYAADMKAHKWDLNGEPIIFDWDDVLQDGQHRLWACVEAATPFETMVTRGVDPATFKTIDTGKARNASDVLSIAGHTNNNVLAAAARLCMEYANPQLISRRISNADVLTFVEKNKGLHQWVLKVRGDKLTKTSGSILAAVMYLGANRFTNRANDFLEQFGKGENLPVGSPVLALRNRLLADRRLTRKERFGLVILTWNAFVTGRSLQRTQLPRTDLPKIAGAEKH